MPNKMTHLIRQTTRNRAVQVLDRYFGGLQVPPATSVAGYLHAKEEKAKAQAAEAKK
jgi:hypothetical protein